MITDLGSINGTTVGGRRLPPHMPTPVSPSDTVLLGSNARVTVSFLMQSAPRF